MAKSILKFVLAFLLAVCLMLVCLVGFGPAGISGLLTDDDITVTNELKDGQAIRYILYSDSDTDAQTLSFYARATSRIIYDRLAYLGINNSKVLVTGEDSLAVFLPNNAQVSAINNTIGVRGEVSMKTENSASAENFIVSDDIESCTVIANQSSSSSSTTTYSLSLHLSAQGLEKYNQTVAQAISSEDPTVYLFVDGTQVSSLIIEGQAKDNDIVFGSFSQENAVVYSMMINTGAVPCEISSSIVYASAEYPSAYNGMFIALIVTAAAAAIYLVFRFSFGGAVGAVSVVAAVGAGLLLNNAFNLGIGLNGLICFGFVVLEAFLMNAAILRSAKIDGTTVKKSFVKNKWLLIDLIGLPLIISIAMMFYSSRQTALLSDILFVSSLTSAISALISLFAAGDISYSGKNKNKPLANV